MGVSPAERSISSWPSDAGRDALPAGPPCCPACGAAAWSARLLWTSLRDCLACGAVLNDRSATRREEEARYLQPDRRPEGGDGRRAAARWRLARRVAKGPGGGSPAVLDVGCGDGAFLREAVRDGARAHGIEIDPRAAAAARSTGLDITQGSVLDVRVSAGPWDLVTFWDVLDQVDDPAGAIRAVLPHLRPGGLVLARGRNGALHVPAKRFSLRMRRLVGGFPDPAVVHRWGFDPGAWRRLLDRTGLRGVRVRGTGPGLPGLPASVLAHGRREEDPGPAAAVRLRKGGIFG